MSKKIGEPWRTALNKIAQLDIKQRKLEFEAGSILKTSAFCQAPPIYHRTLDKIIVIMVKKAVLWDHMKGYILPGTTKTLWQIAVDSKRLPVKLYGPEGHLDFYAQDIEAAIKEACEENS